MLYQRTGFPEEGELVLCTITKVQSHSVFAKLEEFTRSGMIHISEVSPGRIRNIRDYVKEGKVVVCQVLRINKERGYIDLSLRRVNDNQRRKKVNQVKQEQKAEKILEFVAGQMKKDIKIVYRDVFGAISQYYQFLHQAFQDLVKGNVTMEELEVPKTYLPLLEEVVRQRIKPEEVYVGGKLFVQSYAPNGLAIVKEALHAGEKVGKKETTIRYLGGGAFDLTIKGEEYKETEKVLKSVLEAIQKAIPKGKGTLQFERVEKKAIAS